MEEKGEKGSEGNNSDLGKKKERDIFQFQPTPQLAKAIDELIGNRYRTRSEAIRALIWKGLDMKEAQD